MISPPVVDVGVVAADEEALLPMLLLVVSTDEALAPAAGFADVSASISTLNRTLRAKNLSGERYSQRNRLGLLML